MLAGESDLKGQFTLKSKFGHVLKTHVFPKHFVFYVCGTQNVMLGRMTVSPFTLIASPFSYNTSEW